MSLDNTLYMNVKRSDLNAVSEFDLQLLVYPNARFLRADIHEDAETIGITYHFEGKHKFVDIKKEDIVDILSALNNAGMLYDLAEKFTFSLNPDNIFYDDQFNVYVMKRDIYPEDSIYDPEEFAGMYKSLVGFALQDKYTYEDYNEGGNDLFRENRELKKLADMDTPEKVVSWVSVRENDIRKDRAINYKLYPWKKFNRTIIRSRIYFIGFIISMACLAVGLIYVLPYHVSSIRLVDAYEKYDYVQCIDSMEHIPVTWMSTGIKYMLADAYVNNENLSSSQKDNIKEISAISILEPKTLEYWIYLGRNNFAKAEDIALRLQNPELELYAYIRDKDNLEADTKMKGEKKKAKLSDVDDKINTLLQKINGDEGNSNE
ncbi:MAG: type VII secretion protein EssB/YukC [Catonella sp.]|nr:type VII secretion protein EssB/YukC [Catonella sp.]MDY6355948.1 type VII secretion protein EssB/YukC [Catonella sp.]